jgi:hypothetical protein
MDLKVSLFDLFFLISYKLNVPCIFEFGWTLLIRVIYIHSQRIKYNIYGRFIRQNHRSS